MQIYYIYSLVPSRVVSKITLGRQLGLALIVSGRGFYVKQIDFA